MPTERRRAAAALCIAAALSNVGPLTAASITREEALAAVYPGATITVQRLFLTEEQMKQAASLAGRSIPSALIARYLASKEGKPIGRAYVDTHVVRTKKESLLISLDQNGAVKRIDVTAFMEPQEYESPESWRGQYRGKVLTDDLSLQRAIRPIAGATLTAVAVNEAVRRVLGIDQVLQGTEGGTRR